MKSKKKIWIRFGISAAFAVIFLLFALFAGKFAPYDPLETHYTDLLKAPCKQYLLGTDQMGRDIFSRILYGGKTSLLIAFAVTAIISVVGILAKKGYGFVTGEDGEDYFAHFSQIKMEGFKRLSGKQPVQFEVGADENGREIAVNIVPLTTGEEA